MPGKKRGGRRPQVGASARRRKSAGGEGSPPNQGRLLAAMAHDVRSPLGSVHVWLELLRGHALDPSAARAVAMIDRSLRDLNELVSQFAEMSRLLSGELRLEKHATDLPALVDAALASAEEAARAKGVRLAGTRLDRTIPTIRADSNRLRQALEALVGSAVRSTPPHGSVDVVLERTPGRVRIEVRDSGPPMTRSQLTEVFDRFQSGQTRGGLGLAIAQRVVALHGGRLHAASGGRRTVFVLELPL